jgi:hypothetical protein
MSRNPFVPDESDRWGYAQVPLFLPAPPPPEPPPQNPHEQLPGVVEIDPDTDRGVIIIDL